MYRIHLVSNRTIIQNYRNLNITRRLSIKTFNNYYYRILKSKQILVRKRNSISKRFFQMNLDFKEISINMNSNDTVNRSIFFFFFAIRHGIFLNITGRKTDLVGESITWHGFYLTKPSPVEKRNGRKVLLQGVHLMTRAFFFFFPLSNRTNSRVISW